MKIALCLSGGGFRAMLFHLGVLRRLAKAGLLPSIVRIDSVSGGSILAAHAALRWNEYKADAIGTSDALIGLAKRDLRGRIIRRRLLCILCGMPVMQRLLRRVAPALASRLRIRVTDLLEREYGRFYGGERLHALCSAGADGPPSVYLHTTSLATGDACAFAVRRGESSAKFLVRKEPEPVDGSGTEGAGHGAARQVTTSYLADRVPIGRAVAASSAFPPMFQPVEASVETIGDKTLDKTHPLTDGGVFDNLGIHWQLAEPAEVDCTLISDADGGLVPDYRRGFRFVLTRNIRSSDILMNRNAALLRDASGLDLESDRRRRHPFAARALVIPIAPTRPLKHHIVDAQRQSALRDIRTDLDAFSDVEISHLLAHGWAVADAVLREGGIVSPADSVAPPGALPDASHEVLERSGIRSWGLWAPGDGLGMLYAVLLVAYLTFAVFTVQRAWNTPTVRLSDAEWADVSRVWFNEPSGLAATGLTRQGQPVLLGVDDEESALFILQQLDRRHPGIINVGSFASTATDLEDVAFDACAGIPEGVALTSHRQFRERGLRSVNRLMFFTLNAGWARASEPAITSGQDVSLHKGLQALLDRAGAPVHDDAWAEEAPEPSPDEGEIGGFHPYAVEVEGVAYARGTVTIGVRWPLAPGGKAILWQFDRKELDDPVGRFETFDLGGRGISALTWVGDRLYIAANPPEKELRSTRTGYPFGHFGVYRRIEENLVEAVTDLDPEIQQITDAKLEGLAVVGDTLIGAFDGPGHTVRPLGRVAAEDRLQSTWRERVSHWWNEETPLRCSAGAAAGRSGGY